MTQFWPQLLAQAPAQPQDLGATHLIVLLGGLIVAIFLVLLAVTVLAYGRLWFQAYMSNARVRFLSLIGMSLRQVNSGVILKAKIMALQAGVGNDPHHRHHHAPARGPLSGRRQRAERDQRDHRRPPGRHRLGLRSRRGHRPGRPRRAGSGAHERLSESDRLPRSDQGQEVALERRGQKRRRAEDSCPRDGPHQPGAAHRRSHRRNDHRPRRRRHHHLDRFGRRAIWK